MAPAREGLRPPKKKPGKPPPMTNAERCKKYRAGLAADKIRNEIAKQKKKEANQKYWSSLTGEQKDEHKERSKLRQQKRRAKQNVAKASKVSTEATVKPNGKAKPKGNAKPPQTPTKTRQQVQKEAIRKEKNRLSQQKRRANMTPQKKRREREKRRARYLKAKNKRKDTLTKGKVRLAQLLRGAVNSFKRARSKLALFKLDFFKRLLAREDPTATKDLNSYYKCSTTFNKHSLHNFLENNSIDFPGKKGSSMPKKVLTRSMADLFSEFKKKNPEVKMSFSTFKRRRPPHIVLSSSRKFLQCLCEKCTNAMLLMSVINSELPRDMRIANVETLVNKTLCESVSKFCVERECSSCGVDALFSSFEEQISDLSKERKWSCWEKTERCSKDLVFRHSSVSEILSLLKQNVSLLSKHLKVAQWQRKQYQLLQANLPKGHAVCTVDFAENYLCKFQNEVQSAHWAYKQVTVHPCVFHYRCDKPSCYKVITEYFVILSDVLKHDNAFTRLIFDLCISKLKSYGITAFHIFSDGCSSQYKSRYTMRDLVALQSKHPSIFLTRHYFGSNHGKSLCDSCGGTVKNVATRAVLSGSSIIQSAAELFDFCCDKMTVTDSGDCSSHQSLRSFHLVSTEDIVSFESSVKAVKGIQAVHCVNPISTGKINVKHLSCFCEICLIGEEGECNNVQFTGVWESHQICQNYTMLTSSPVNSVCRDEFFIALQQKLATCTNFKELHAVATVASNELSAFPLYPVKEMSILDIGGAVDALAESLVPDYLRPLHPLLVVADGNCVPRSLSVLCFGTENCHTEIRCRIAIELALNSFDYLCLESSDLSLLQQFSDCYSENLQETFQAETLSICQMSQYMGIWQLMAAANSLGASILSVYPPLGPSIFRKFMNRTIRPRHATSNSTMVIFWSATKHHHETMPQASWTANHVVPMLGLSRTIDIDVED